MSKRWQDPRAPIARAKQQAAEAVKLEELDQDLSEINFKEWAAEPNGVFRPTCTAVPSIPPAVYRLGIDDRGPFLSRMNVETDNLIVLDDTVSDKIVKGIEKFWDRKEKYEEYGIVYKRGVLMYGPQGTGKTGAIMLLTKRLIDKGGIVIFISNPNAAAVCLHILRVIEPERPLICIYEDIDELIREHGEHNILALLDGEHQISNCVNLASTNYPDKLGGRIMNRPSRFDEIHEVSLPNAKSRKLYLAHITKHDPLERADFDKWIKDTDKFSISHIRELVIAVRCLGQEYNEVIARLREMTKKKEPVEEFANAEIKTGFGVAPKQKNGW